MQSTITKSTTKSGRLANRLAFTPDQHAHAHAHAHAHTQTHTHAPIPEPASRGGFTARGERRIGPPARRTMSCPVCRCGSVRVDEVDAAGPLRLAECPRCEHRWTSRTRIVSAPSSRGRVAFVHASRLDAAAQA